jgi:hypothetical protein
MKIVTVQRTGPLLQPNRTRVLIRPFQPNDEETCRRTAAPEASETGARAQAA